MKKFLFVFIDKSLISEKDIYLLMAKKVFLKLLLCSLCSQILQLSSFQILTISYTKFSTLFQAVIRQKPGGVMRSKASEDLNMTKVHQDDDYIYPSLGLFTNHVDRFLAHFDTFCEWNISISIFSIFSVFNAILNQYSMQKY